MSPSSSAPAAIDRSGGRADAVVVGGGIAGIATAVRLAEAGLSVALLETRKKLGGRATSFTDARSGRVLDNCQHVVLGCCTNYLDLLARLGVAGRIAWHREQYWVEEGGVLSVVRPGPLPVPMHFATSMLRSRFLSLAEVAAIGRACAKILRTERSGHAGETFAAFLRRCGQPERVIRRFWAPVVVSACNLGVDFVAASVAMHVFQEGFLAHARAADIGVPSVPLVELYRRAETLIGAAGGRVVLGTGVERIDESGATTTDGARFEGAKGVVCAVPVERVTRLVDPEVQKRDGRFAPLSRFTHSPILGVHLTFDRPVLRAAGRDLPHAVLVDRPTQWLFRKDEAGAYIHAVISAADEWVPLDEEEIGRRVISDLHACLPESGGARPTGIRAVKEKLATFAPTPGTDAIRPGPASAASRIVLAGDYTATGWPATMEGAARSGYAAAAAVLGRDAAELVVRSLPVAPLAGALGLRST